MNVDVCNGMYSDLFLIPGLAIERYFVSQPRISMGGYKQ
jgi:hypothetical protein